MNTCMFCGCVITLTPEQAQYALVYYPRLLYVCDECWSKEKERVLNANLMNNPGVQEYIALRVLEHAANVLVSLGAASSVDAFPEAAGT